MESARPILHEEELSKTHPSNLTILVVDDDPIVLKCFEKMLAHKNFGKQEEEINLIDSILGAEAKKDPSQENAYNIEKLELAGSGGDAIRIATKIKESHQPLDIVFCDIRMPELDGIQTAKALMETAPDLNIAFVTGYYDIKQSEIKEVLGRDIKVIHKPFRQRDLLAYIDHVLQGC